MILRDPGERHADHIGYGQPQFGQDGGGFILQCFVDARTHESGSRSEEHTSELQSLMRISYAVFCLKKKKRKPHTKIKNSTKKNKNTIQHNKHKTKHLNTVQ